MRFLIKIRGTPDTVKWHTGCGSLRLNYPSAETLGTSFSNSINSPMFFACERVCGATKSGAPQWLVTMGHALGRSSPPPAMPLHRRATTILQPRFDDPSNQRSALSASNSADRQSRVWQARWQLLFCQWITWRFFPFNRFTGKNNSTATSLWLQASTFEV
jgi:hypothetical protein